MQQHRLDALVLRVVVAVGVPLQRPIGVGDEAAAAVAGRAHGNAGDAVLVGQPVGVQALQAELQTHGTGDVFVGCTVRAAVNGHVPAGAALHQGAPLVGTQDLGVGDIDNQLVHTARPIRKFVGAPAPKDIAEAAFGRRLDDKLRKATVERLLPCIVDGQPLPRDLMESTVHRACNRAGLDHWVWEKNLGIACALFKGFFKEREYQMTLETNRISRDYLYGRLLAIAEHVEGRALYLSGETRDTTASKLTQRFADRPASTWRIIALALKPYMSRLRAKRPAFLREMEKLLDEVVPSFQGDDFLDDSRLSGEFLLGYHCQRQVLNPRKTDKPDSNEDTLTE